MSSSAPLDAKQPGVTISLTPPPSPVSFGSGYIVKEDCTLEIRCQDRDFREALVTDENGSQVFTLQGKAPLASWSVRRSLKDASGNPVWDLHHNQSKLNQWSVDDPQGKELCTIKNDVPGRDKITAMQARVGSDMGEVTISMQSFDHAGTRTVFEVEGATIAELHLMENNDLSFLKWRGLARSVWKVRMAGGVDMALILALAFCRAEVSHAWRR
ncbi:MAG: hypothetical protein M1821_008807 [Bathelium mastoideum]|nr:MAG: hypothetical protein M1821_008807 [Bathelium mastoideum]KAI9687616.1 MAG: hypothetical protein M1822_002226 [Bathelium mastoideum]